MICAQRQCWQHQQPGEDRHGETLWTHLGKRAWAACFFYIDHRECTYIYIYTCNHAYIDKYHRRKAGDDCWIHFGRTGFYIFYRLEIPEALLLTVASCASTGRFSDWSCGTDRVHGEHPRERTKIDILLGSFHIIVGGAWWYCPSVSEKKQFEETWRNTHLVLQCWWHGVVSTYPVYLSNCGEAPETAISRFWKNNILYTYVYIYVHTHNDSLIWIKAILGHLPLIIIIRRHFSWNRRNIYPDYPVPCHTTLLAMAPEFHAPFIRSTWSSNSGNRIPGCLLFSFATRLADGPAQQQGFIRDFCLEMGVWDFGVSYFQTNPFGPCFLCTKRGSKEPVNRCRQWAAVSVL